MYEATSSKHVRRYIQSVMAAKVAKEYLYNEILLERLNGGQIQMVELVDSYVKLVMEGNNTNSS